MLSISQSPPVQASLADVDAAAAAAMPGKYAPGRVSMSPSFKPYPQASLATMGHTSPRLLGGLNKSASMSAMAGYASLGGMGGMGAMGPLSTNMNLLSLAAAGGLSMSSPTMNPFLPNFTANSVFKTQILSLSDFSPELKTKHICAAFSPWESDRGGFRVKWIDNTSCLIVFAHPLTARDAYATLIGKMPKDLVTDLVPARVRPYLGDDAAEVIASVQNRVRSGSTGIDGQMRSHNRSRSTASRIGGDFATEMVGAGAGEEHVLKRHMSMGKLPERAP